MRIMLRWIHGWPVPEQLAIGKVKEAFDDDGNLVNEETKERLQNLVESVLENTEIITVGVPIVKTKIRR